ncbi:MAG: hypothetical protein IPJ18_03795 [Betaproteobacteria bacterium]|nr:hypothetical protein [Betaproteobacteria bacterium]
MVELQADRHSAILTEVIDGSDWSAGVVPGATLADLDPAAIAKAREKFAAKHQQEHWAADIAGWDAAEFWTGPRSPGTARSRAPH